MTISAEFNFGWDPEAAASVLSEVSCPVDLVTWETSSSHTLSWVGTAFFFLAFFYRPRSWATFYFLGMGYVLQE